MDTKWISDIPPGLVGVGAFAGIKLLAAYYLHRKQVRSVGRVSELFIHPIKSCTGISVLEAECDHMGLRYGPFLDRHWQVVDNNGVFLSQKTVPGDPRLSLIVPSFHGDKLHVDGPGMDTLVLDTNAPIRDEDIVMCKVWGEPIKAVDCGPKAKEWIRRFLGREDVSIVHADPRLPKRDMAPVKKKFTNYHRKGDHTAFQDFSAYNILGKPSVDDLNKRCEKKTGTRLYRANIVVDGCKPYEEDEWEYITVGPTTFYRVKPCQRCVVVTVDQEVGNKPNDLAEPLTTLRQYRMASSDWNFGNAPILGTNIAINGQGGKIKVGDEVSAIYG